MKLKSAVFLDRDGVLNKSFIQNGKPFAPRRLEDFHIFPEAGFITQSFQKMGLHVIVVTNQPDVGNGFVTQSVVEAMHVMLAKTVFLDEIMVCYHSQTDGCSCRKPKPGMLLKAAEKFGIDFQRSVMIGDRYSDVLAGRAAGCRTILIDYSYQESALCQPNLIVDSLEEAANAIISQKIFR